MRTSGDGWRRRFRFDLGTRWIWCLVAVSGQKLFNVGQLFGLLHDDGLTQRYYLHKLSIIVLQIFQHSSQSTLQWKDTTIFSDCGKGRTKSRIAFKMTFTFVFRYFQCSQHWTHAKHCGVVPCPGAEQWALAGREDPSVRWNHRHTATEMLSLHMCKQQHVCEERLISGTAVLEGCRGNRESEQQWRQQRRRRTEKAALLCCENTVPKVREMIFLEFRQQHFSVNLCHWPLSGYTHLKSIHFSAEFMEKKNSLVWISAATRIPHLSSQVLHLSIQLGSQLAHWGEETILRHSTRKIHKGLSSSHKGALSKRTGKGKLMGSPAFMHWALSDISRSTICRSLIWMEGSIPNIRLHENAAFTWYMSVILCSKVKVIGYKRKEVFKAWIRKA